MVSRREYQDERHYFSRTHLAQVSSVDTRNGRVTVDYLSTRQRKTLQVPHFGFAINGTSSSWDRYMPQANEVVTVNHEMDGTPHITTYTPYGDGSAGVGGHNLPGHGGYAEVADLTDAGAPGLGYNFVELRPGEYHRRSSGGATTYWTADGTLFMSAGGGASMELRKRDQEEKHSAAQRTLYETGGVTVQWGEVRRDVPVVANPTSAPSPREHYLRVASPVAPLIDVPLYESVVGDVRDSLGVPELSSGVPVRDRKTWMSAAGTTTLNFTVDVLGNVNITQAPSAAAGGIKVTSLACPLSTSFRSTSISSLTTSTISGGTAVVLSAPLVQLGGTAATEPLLLGLKTVAAMTPYTTAEADLGTALAALMPLMVAGFTSAGVTPITHSALHAALTALAGLATAQAIASTSLPAALTAAQSLISRSL